MLKVIHIQLSAIIAFLLVAIPAYATKSDALTDPFFNNDQTWNNPSSSNNINNTEQPKSIIIPEEAVTRVQIKPPANQNNTTSLPPASSPETTQPQVVVPNIDIIPSPTGVHAPTGNPVNTTSTENPSSSQPASSADERPLPENNVHLPIAAPTQSNVTTPAKEPSTYKEIIKASGQDQVEAAAVTAAPKQMPGVTNLSPNNVAAPKQPLSNTDTSVLGSLESLKNKIETITQPHKTTVNTEPTNVKPVVIEEDLKKTEAPDVKEALSIIMKSDTKKFAEQELRDSTRKVYSYKNIKPKKPGELTIKSKSYRNNISPELATELAQSLFIAIHTGNIGAAQALIDNGADINAITADGGLTPLMYAVSMNQEKIVRYLLAKGANINYTIADGSTALSIAGRNNNIEIFADLLQFGADYLHQDSADLIPFDYLSDENKARASITLARKCEHLDSCLIENSILGGIDGVSLLLKRGANINYQDVRGDTALIIANRFNNFSLANFLLNKGADPRITNRIGKKALDYAIETDNINLAQILITVETKLELEAPPKIVKKSEPKKATKQHSKRKTPTH